MKRKKVVLLLIFTLFLIAVEKLNAYFIRNYGDTEGMSMNICISTVQDERGYIWIATQEGLNRFDGAHFKIFGKKDGLPHDFLNTLYYSKRKKELWIGTQFGLSRYKDERFRNYLTENQNPVENDINCIIENNDQVLIGTDSGMYVIKDQKLIRYKENEALLRCRVDSITVDEIGVIYIGSQKNGLVIIDREKIFKFSNKNGLMSENISALLYDQEKGIWIGTDSGLSLYEYKEGKINQKEVYSNDNSDLPKNSVNALFKDSKNIFWIGTEDGLYQKKQSSIFKFPGSKELIGNTILSILEDKDGDLWIGGYGGVSFITKDIFRAYSKDNGLLENTVFGIYPQGKKIWIATSGGIAIIEENDENNIKIRNFTTENTDKSLPSNSILNITGDKAGNVWISTFGGGLIQYKGGKFKAYTKADGLPNNDVRFVYVDEDKDNLWVGLKNGGFAVFSKKNGKLRFEEKYCVNEPNSKGIISDNARFIYKDSKGNMWIGFDKGISIFKEEFIDLTKKMYTKNFFPLGMLEDSEKHFWISTYGDGLFYFKDNPEAGQKPDIVYKTDNGLPNNFLYNIVEDSDGYLWMPSNKGICRFDKKKKTFLNYTVDYGLPANENNAFGGVRDDLGRIWFSTHKGAFWINPNDLPNTPVPDVVIEEIVVKIDNKQKPSMEKINHTFPVTETDFILENKKNNITIKFTAVGFQFPSALKFQVKLDGLPPYDKWSNPTNDKSVEYTSLPPGEYKFNVRAFYVKGVYKEANFSFTIMPTFYQTFWFYFLIVLFVLLVIYIFFQYRISQQRRQEQKVNARIEELNKIQIQLYQQDKMASLGQLVAGIAHEVNNPVNSINGNASHLKKYIADIRLVLEEYMKLDLNPGHQINQMIKDLKIETEIELVDDLVKYIKEGAVRIADIVQALRNFARINERVLQQVDIHDGIEDTLFLLNNKIKGKVDVKKHFGTIPKIDCYPGQLNQAIMNLISNAVDAIPDHGTITIETKLEGSDSIIIKISDTGEGIPGENSKHIFEPFFTTKGVNEGTGLGLAITHSIIQDHSGKISFDSEVGKGTTFTITLPINQGKKLSKVGGEF